LISRMTLSMSSSRGLNDLEEVRGRVMDPWLKAAPHLVPTSLQVGEPVRKAFDPAAPEIPNGSWAARRNSPRLDAAFSPGFGRIHADLNVSVVTSAFEDVVGLADALATTMQVHFGLVHRLTDGDRDAGRLVNRQDVRIMNWRTGVAESQWGFTVQISQGLPTLFWRTYLGRPYIDLIGRARLLESPAHEVIDRGDLVVVTLSPEPPDETTYPSFDDARQRVIDHLGRDLFWPSASRVPDLPPPVD
jgi:hypothetical protein